MADPLSGIGVSPGRAVGPALIMSAVPVLPPAQQVTSAEDETDRATRALAAVLEDLRSRAGHATTREAKEVLAAQAALAADPVLLDGITARIGAGQDAPHAVEATFAEYRAVFASAGGMLAERAADLEDLAARTLAVLLDRPMPGIPDPGHPFILIAEDLSPADTASLDPAAVLALVTERGGPTSHTAILARALGLPAVIGCQGVREAVQRYGDLVSVDGTTGQIRCGVAETEAVKIRAALTAQRAEAGHDGGPGRSADGHPIDLMVNIGSAADLASVDLTGIAGVGLFRTEFLFLDRTDEPGLEEQIAAYTSVFASVPQGVIVVRTLDAGADKPLPFLGLPEEPNPALGLRGLRVARRLPDLLDTQLHAIARAAATASARVWVMAPMVSTATEAAGFAERAHAHGLPMAGAMVEVPAAALHARRLLRVVEFLSIGTNDLSQYTLAADRQTGDLPDLLDPWQPAVLQLVAHCAQAGRDLGKPVGVCGEAAADPLLAPVLVGLGITRLSMSPRSIPAVRAALATHTLAQCTRLAERALDTDDAHQARAAVRSQ